MPKNDNDFKNNTDSERQKKYDEFESKEKELFRSRMEAIHAFYDKLQAELLKRDLTDVRTIDLMKLYLKSGELLDKDLERQKCQYNKPFSFKDFEFNI